MGELSGAAPPGKIDMSDFVIVTGDLAVFNPAFGEAMVASPPGIITGSSRAKVGNATVCVVGDESTVIVSTATYLTPAFPTPGSGVVTIAALASDQQASRTRSALSATILVGSQFRAQFRVTAPATGPGPSSDAPGRVYTGSGSFTTANGRTKAT